MKEIKVLFVIRTLLRAGAERMLVNTCNELLQRHNFEVAIYTVNPGNEFQGILDPRVIVNGGDVNFHFSLYKKNRVENKNYINFVTAFKPNIIHSHLHYGDLLTHTYHYPQAIYFSHQHNSEVQEYNGINWKKVYIKRMWSDFYEFSWLKDKFKKHETNFIACSAGTKAMLENKIGFGKITTLPNAIPLPMLNYTHKPIKEEVFNIIWVGRFSDAKRPDLAIKVAKELKDKNIKFKLKMIGHGKDITTFELLINQLGLHNYVDLLGLVDKMDEVYTSANLMLHTAIYEGFPMVFIEANSYGIPIISSDCMPNNEFLERGKNGDIIFTDNPIEFANSIEKIITQPILYEKLSKQSIETAKAFGIQTYVEKLVEIYKKAI